MKSLMRPAYAAASIVAAAGILAAGLALKPAFATGAAPDTACHSGSPCQTYKNGGLGAGLQGINTNNSPFSSGLIGTDTKFGAGVTGTSVSGFGVSGTSTNATGVTGTGSSFGTFGFSSDGTGVEGQSTNGFGLIGFSSNFVGIEGASSTSTGVLAISESTAPALEALGSTGNGIDVFADGGDGVYETNSNGNGADISGTYIGIVPRAPDCSTGSHFPIAATDQVGNNLFYVDCGGTAFAHSFGTFSRTRDGNVATAYTSKTTTPTVEDNGSARLVGGVANVALDGTFAKSIDTRQTYQVMLTPDGDTRGLFVASKSPTGFVVREVQGGHGSISFDYHIYATSLGQAGERMTEMSPAQSAMLMPHVKVLKDSPIKTTIKTLHPH